MKQRRYFQWLDGESAGQVETLDNITCTDGEYFYNFKSGEACNQRFISQMTRNPGDLKGKVMVEIANPSDTWKFETVKMGRRLVMDENMGEHMVDVPPIEDITGASGNGNNLNIERSKIGEKRFTPPRYRGEMWELPSYNDYNGDYVEDITPRKVNPVPVEFEPVQMVPVNKPVSISGVSESDPVRILAKTCKKHETEVNLTVTINLPSKSIYNIAKAEFENGGEKFVDCLVEEMNISEIVKSISDALRASYEEE